MSKQSEPIEPYANAVFKHAAVGMLYLDLNGRVMQSNPAAQAILGYDSTQLTSLTLSEIIHPTNLGDIEESIQNLKSENNAHRCHELRCFDNSGKTLWLRINLSLIPKTETASNFILAIIENLTDQKQGLDNPHISRQLFEAMAESVPVTVWLTDIDGEKVHFLNQAFLDTWEIERDEAYSRSGLNLLSKVHPDDLDLVKTVVSKKVKNNRWVQNFRIIKNDKSIHYLESTGIILRNADGKAEYLLGTHHDVTDNVLRTHKLENLNQQLQETYKEVSRLNQFDGLTTCLNRNAVLAYISDAYYQFKRYEIPSSIIYIDLNNFKEINDAHGHHAGDLVLKNFVQHMQKRIRQTDTLGRLGGDEFILLLPSTSRENSELFLQKEKPEFISKINDNLEISCSYSAGIQECDFSFANVDEWLDAADKVMYAEKNHLKA